MMGLAWRTFYDAILSPQNLKNVICFSRAKMAAVVCCFKYWVSAGLPKRQKNYSSFNFLRENLEKFRSTEPYGAALEGSTIFLCRSSLGCTSMESCQLADLKYVIFSSTGCKTKKLPRSKLFVSMVFKHGLLEGSTSGQMWSTVFPGGWDAR